MGNRAVFLDRDGTLIEHYDFLTDESQVQLQPRAAAALRLLKDRNFKLVMVTNQSGVARGIITEKKLAEIHDHLRMLLAQEGAYLDKIYYCPYHPEAVIEKYRQESELRKPQPGMLYKAAEELDIDLGRSWVVGDDDRDIAMGRAAGCRTVLLEHRGSPLVQRGGQQPDFQAVNLQEAANLILRRTALDEEKKTQRQAVVEEVVEKTAEQNQPIEEILPPQQQEEQIPPPPEQQTQTQIAEQMPSRESASGQESSRLTITETKREAFPEPAVEEVTEAQPVKEKELEGGGAEPPVMKEILRELRKLNQEKKLGEDFSGFKLMAAIMQMVVILCLVLAFWKNSGPNADAQAAQIFLLAGLVFQTMALTFLMMHKS